MATQTAIRGGSKMTRKGRSQEWLVTAAADLLRAARENTRAGGDVVGVRDERTVDARRASLKASHAFNGGGLSSFGHGTDYPLTPVGALAYIATQIGDTDDVGEVAVRGRGWVSPEARLRERGRTEDRRMIQSLIRELREQAAAAHGGEHAQDCPHDGAAYEPTQVGCTCGFSSLHRAIERARKHLMATGRTSDFEVAPPRRIRAGVAR